MSPYERLNKSVGDKSGLDVPKEGKLPWKVNKKTKLIEDYIKCREESFSLKLGT